MYYKMFVVLLCLRVGGLLGVSDVDVHVDCDEATLNVMRNCSKEESWLPKDDCNAVTPWTENCRLAAPR